MSYEHTAYSGFGGVNGVVSDQAAQLVAATFKKAGAVTEVGNKYVDRIRGKALQWVKGRVEKEMSAALPFLNRAEQLARDSYGAYKTVQETVERIRSGAIEADVSGALDAAGLAFQAVSSISQMARRIGVDNVATRELASWGGIGSGCAAMISANYLAGGIGCAVSVFGKMFSMIAGSGPPSRPDSNQTPQAYFVPVPQAMPHAVSDAARLAQVLANRYDSPTYAQMLAKLGSIGDVRGIYSWILGMYPGRPQYNDPGNNTDGVPGHTLRTILNLLDFERSATQADANIRNCLAALSVYLGGKHGALYHDWYHDLDVDLIELGAFFARAGIVQHGNATVGASFDCIDTHAFHPDGPCRGMPIERNQTVSCDFAPFLRLDELLNYFAAISAVEFRKRRIDETLEWTGIGRNLIVQVRHVKDYEGDPAFYSKMCWTNLHDFEGQSCRGIVELLQRGDHAAFKELATVRLMAAFSYMNLNYRWHDGSGEGDLIIKMRQLRNDPYYELTLPIDPRQAEGRGTAGWRLKPYETAPVSNKAVVYKQNSAQIFQTAYMGHYPIARGDWLAQRILDREALIGALRAEPTPLKATGFTFDANYRSPTNVGGILLIGAAALAAMKFLK